MDFIMIYFLGLMFILVSNTLCSNTCSKSQNSSSTDSLTTKRSSIYRPCPTMDLSCIQDFFNRNARCKRLPHADNVTNVFETPYDSRFFMNSNVSLIDLPTRFHRFGDAHVTDFYVNKKTNKTLLSLYFNAVGAFGPAKYIHYRSRQEPKELITDTTELYDFMKTTTIFDSATNLDILRSGSHAFLPTIAYLRIGEGFRQNRDPEWLVWMNEMACLNQLSVKEIFVNRANAFTSYFIQHYLCNYGVGLTATPLKYLIL